MHAQGSELYLPMTCYEFSLVTNCRVLRFVACYKLSPCQILGQVACLGAEDLGSSKRISCPSIGF